MNHIVRLHPDHLADLRRSGLSDETIKMMGVYSARPVDIPKLVGWDPKEIESALVFPYFGLDGKPDRFYRVKVFPPYKDKEGHAVKYLQRKGTSPRLYVLPPVRKILDDPSGPFIITEGEKKGAKGVQEGLPVVAVGGAWNWIKKGTCQGIEDLDRITWDGRVVLIIPDTDTWTEPDLKKRDHLQQAFYAFGEEIEGRGAKVRFLVLPQGSEEKAGLDDCLLRQPKVNFRQLPYLTLENEPLCQHQGWYVGWKVRKQEQQAGDLKPQGGPVLDPIAELVSLLNDLDEKSSLTKVEESLRSLASALNGADPLRRATVRESALKILEKIGISAPARLLDAALGNGQAETEQQGRPVLFDDPDPWSEPVDGAGLLDDLVATLQRFVVFPSHAPQAVALWVLHAHALEAFSISPILAIISAIKRSGKTLLLEVVSLLVPRHLFASNITSSVLFRAVEKFTPTLLIDEADTFVRDNDELRGVLNASHRRVSALVLRNVGDEHEPTMFATWCAKAIALIGKLPATLEDRSVLVSLKRKSPDEQVERFRIDRVAPELATLKRKAARWAADNLDALRKADPETPSVLNDRASDNWRPLLAIADLAGGEWPERGRAAAVAFSGEADEAQNSALIQLLADLRELFTNRASDRLSSSEIIGVLGLRVDRPWPEWKHGKPLTERQLARLLESLDIHPVQTWIDGSNVRGYRLDAFKDSFVRYLPTDPLGPLGPAPRAEERPISDPLGREGSSGSETARKPAPRADSSGLADRKPLSGVKGGVWHDDL